LTETVFDTPVKIRFSRKDPREISAGGARVVLAGHPPLEE
jgi:hypothetical protein